MKKTLCALTLALFTSCAASQDTQTNRRSEHVSPATLPRVIKDKGYDLLERKVIPGQQYAVVIPFTIDGEHRAALRSLYYAGAIERVALEHTFTDGVLSPVEGIPCYGIEDRQKHSAAVTLGAIQILAMRYDGSRTSESLDELRKSMREFGIQPDEQYFTTNWPRFYAALKRTSRRTIIEERAEHFAGTVADKSAVVLGMQMIKAFLNAYPGNVFVINPATEPAEITRNQLFYDRMSE